MKYKFPSEVEEGRERRGDFATEPGTRFGAFKLRCPLSSTYFTVIVSDGTDWAVMGLPGPPWEHVSMSHVSRTPTWEEMCWLKDLFFGPQECVVQFHPAKSAYVNVHPNCLHLWRIVGGEFPVPPLETV